MIRVALATVSEQEKDPTKIRHRLAVVRDSWKRRNKKVCLTERERERERGPQGARRRLDLPVMKNKRQLNHNCQINQ